MFRVPNASLATICWDFFFFMNWILKSFDYSSLGFFWLFVFLFSEKNLFYRSEINVSCLKRRFLCKYSNVDGFKLAFMMNISSCNILKFMIKCN